MTHGPLSAGINRQWLCRDFSLSNVTDLRVLPAQPELTESCLCLVQSAADVTSASVVWFVNNTHAFVAAGKLQKISAES